MSRKNRNEEVVEAVEMDAAVETAENVEAEVAPVEKIQYQLDDGTNCSRSQLIRQEFKKDKARKDIAAELGVEYYVVYAATTNMYNAEHPENGASTRGATVAKVNTDLKFVDADGNVVETADEAATISRSALMRELGEAGVERSVMATYFDVPYSTVYAATKAVDGLGKSRGAKTLTHPTTGEEIGRADYIRELYAEGEGLDRKAIALHITQLTAELCDYSTVWAATKPKKADEAEVVEPEVPTDVDADTETVE